jgi:Branched-chain amino acid ABC-type transport system, permease components
VLIIIQPVEPSVGTRIYRPRVRDLRARRPRQPARHGDRAMLLGIIESFTATFYGPSWAPAVAFGVLLLTLAFRPAGLLGR